MCCRERREESGTISQVNSRQGSNEGETKPADVTSKIHVMVTTGPTNTSQTKLQDRFGVPSSEIDTIETMKANVVDVRTSNGPTHCFHSAEQDASHDSTFQQQGEL